MSVLPPEVLERSFRLACTDGGKTASALRLVSRSIRQVANLHRFRVVAVSGVEALSTLLDELVQSPPELRVIQHLLICDKPHASACIDLAHSKLPGDHLPRSRIGEQLRRREAEEHMKEARAFMELLPRILQESAASLRSFALVLFNPQHPSVLHHLNVSFPHLHTLYLRYPPWIKDADHLPPTLSMPALNTLTVNVDGALQSQRKDLIRRFGEHCTALKHVTIHSVENRDGSLSVFLEEVVTARNADVGTTKPLAFVRFHISPLLLHGGSSRSIGYVGDQWITVLPGTNHRLKYTDCVQHWQSIVNDLT